MRRKRSVEESFLWSTAILLFLTGMAKLLSAFGEARILDFPDPLWGMSSRHFLVAAASLEFVSAACLLAPIRIEFKYLLCAWLGANFVLYRVALAILSPGKPCPCLGSVAQKLHLNETATSYFMAALAFYLLAAGVFFYRRHARMLVNAQSLGERAAT